MRNILLILLFFFTNTSVMYSLDPNKMLTQYIHNIWQIEDGLPVNSIQCIQQTKDGYLWIGTEEGFVRFDGLSFKVYDKNNTPGLAHNSILDIYEDRLGNLWIGTDGGGLHKFKDGKITHYSVKEGLYNDMINSILEDKAGNIWLGTRGGGLFKYRDNIFTQYNLKEGLSFDVVNCLYEDESGNIWIGTDGGGLNKLRNDKISHYTTNDGLSNDSIFSIEGDKQGNLWIGTYGGGLNKFNNGKFTCYTTRNGLSNDIVYSICIDRQDNLWIGTFGGGLNRFKNGKFTCYSTKEGLSSNIIMSLFESKEGDLWIGTDNGGLNKLRDGKFAAYSRSQKLSNDTITSVYEDKTGILWVGTNNGLNRLKNGIFAHYSTKDGLSHDMIRTICIDRLGNLWIGTEGGGLNKFRNGKFSKYTSKDGLTNDIVYSIYEDNSGILWIGTNGGGLNKLKKGKFSHITSKEGLSNDMVTIIYEDKNENLWIGTDGGGLNKLKNNQISRYTKNDGLSNNTVLSMFEDNSGNLWIGTFGGGLNKFKNEKITCYNKKDGLFDDNIFWIQADNNNNLWITCNKGIFKVNIDELDKNDKDKTYRIKCISYGLADGMLTQECNGGFTPSGWMSIDDKSKYESEESYIKSEIAGMRNYIGQQGKVKRLYFATMKGLLYIDPDNILINQIAPPVIIENVYVNNGEVLLENQVKDTEDRVVLNNDKNNIYIKYTACSFDYPKSLKFKYILEGYDDEWKEALYNLRFKEYTSLPSGTYTFKVTACNSDGIWNEKGAVFKFRILPSFNETIWFYCLCGMGIFIIVFTIYRIRVTQLKAREKDLQRRVDEQTVEIRNQRDEIHKEKEKSESLLLNILPEDIAEELKAKGMVEPVEYKQVSVLFTDFKGFTRIAEKLTPRELIGELDKCFDYFDNLMPRYNLEKLKTIGDSYMCAGGIPVANNTHAIDCILCAFEIQSFMNQMKQIKQDLGLTYWELRLGIHSGPLVAGVVGNKKFAYDIWGDTVNTASRMESSGIVNKINVSYATYQLAKDFFTFDFRGQIKAKEKGLIDMYFVTSLKPELSINGEGKVPDENFKILYNNLKKS